MFSGLAGNLVYAESTSSAGTKNLLSNASFELALEQAKHDWIKNNPGCGSASNWTDMVNPLTIRLSATGQVPEVMPVIEKLAEAVDGNQTVAIPILTNQHGHLTSPVVPMKPGQAYTLSVFARSDDPYATLCLAVWNRPVNWCENPDAQSEPIQVSMGWQRYELTFTVAPYYN